MFSTTSRKRSDDVANSARPFVWQFYGTTVCEFLGRRVIPEGGEQGDPLSLGSSASDCTERWCLQAQDHGRRVSVRVARRCVRHLCTGESVACSSNSSARDPDPLQHVLHHGKTQPVGSPVGHEAFITAQLSIKWQEHQVLLDSIPTSHPSVNQCLSVWEGWASGALQTREALTGPVGLIVWRCKGCHRIVAARITGRNDRFTPVACLEDVQACALAVGTVGSGNWRTEPVRCPRSCGGPTPSWVAT